MNRLFNIGLPKTGTSSLQKAFEILKIKSLHNPLAFRAQAFFGIFDFQSNDQWQAITNFGEHFYPQLDNAYPNSKFILTVRNEEKWLNSWERQISRSPGWEPIKICKNHIIEKTKNFDKNTFEMSNALVRISIFGSCVFNKEQLIYIFRLHKKNVCEYFKDRPQDLLIMDIDNGDGWDKLCGFLNMRIPEGIKFPHQIPNIS